MTILPPSVCGVAPRLMAFVTVREVGSIRVDAGRFAAAVLVPRAAARGLSLDGVVA